MSKNKDMARFNETYNLLRDPEVAYRYSKNRIEVAKLSEEHRKDLDKLEDLILNNISEEETWVRFIRITRYLEQAAKFFCDIEQYEKAAFLRDAVLEEQNDLIKIAKKNKWNDKSTFGLMTGTTSSIKQTIWGNNEEIK